MKKLVAIVLVLTQMAPASAVTEAAVSLPIHAIGDACTASDFVGWSVEGVTITEDRKQLLTCQSGTWAPTLSGVFPACNSTMGIGAACISASGVAVKYAGSDGSALYTTFGDDSSASRWNKQVSWYVYYGANSVSNGATNTSTIVNGQGSSNYAAYLCASKGPGWFLPSINQLQILYNNRVAIGSFSLTSAYWSSSEVMDTNSWYLQFWNNLVDNGDKNQLYAVRCVRRD